MAKVIRSYFKSENDAESAKAILNKLKINNPYIDKIPEDSESTILVPLGNVSTNTNIVSTPSAIAPLKGYNGKEDLAVRKYLLEFEVDEEDHQDALAILMDSDGFVDPNHFE
ncbi:hypothetical protein GH741_21315 [Aquibacillus halophilus]|uniref:Uncharacterized protein n=1 Tax=Aquibacillus halophilus TaxID=930132 RepID=A0A6A8DHI1_9BACI|nr:hypothetical protein [Aquibacillus halophilus]MRH45168.1 hypothetical protein [Aquibacillus halophilus]